MSDDDLLGGLAQLQGWSDVSAQPSTASGDVCLGLADYDMQRRFLRTIVNV